MKKKKNSWGKMKKISFAIVCCYCLLFVISSLMIPAHLEVYEGEKIEKNPLLPISFYEVEEKTVSMVFEGENQEHPVHSYLTEAKLFGIIPIKTIEVEEVPKIWVAPSGAAMGIKMMTQGVIVVGVNDFYVAGKKQNPAIEAGIKEKDIILSANGITLSRLEELTDIVGNSCGNVVELEIKRDNTIFYANVFPQIPDSQQEYRIGVLVRDSAAGIGTITFVDYETGVFGGLGHGICDMDTGQIMEVSEGLVEPSTIVDVKKGEAGAPGELCGIFQEDKILGKLSFNSEAGVFGTLEEENREIYETKELEVGLKNEIKAGEASILSTVYGEEPKEYRVEIVRVNQNDFTGTKNLLIEITDERLLELTGGIVQGMSGSPIIQNGKLIGAVTHVFVNDPTRGYGIFIENMLSMAEGME